MGDHDQAGAPLPVQLQHQLEDTLRIGSVQVARRLVGENDLRFRHQRPGHRSPLPLAAGELVRAMSKPLSQAHALEYLASPVFRFGNRSAPDEEWHRHILESREFR